DRPDQGRWSDLSAAAHAGGQGPRSRFEAHLCAVLFDPAVAADREHRAAGQGMAAIDRGARTARWAVGMHPVLLLLDRLPLLLVEWRALSRPGRAAAGLSLDRR